MAFIINNLSAELFQSTLKYDFYHVTVNRLELHPDASFESTTRNEQIAPTVPERHRYVGVCWFKKEEKLQNAFLSIFALQAGWRLWDDAYEAAQEAGK